ncbi:hypothetical protein KUTeg_008590 [Tegillarca granosa]|uniref:Uncharacterized protein n=1 Tax=Tegillarca granosa TaxID=220873 RepID=A0ABQ9F9J4_TEGGR|nr:hypothetical protein KUTeg_008590 [Tegillarca granosa]
MVPGEGRITLYPFLDKQSEALALALAFTTLFPDGLQMWSIDLHHVFPFCFKPQMCVKKSKYKILKKARHQAFQFLQQIRGSPSYWQHAQYKLLAMVRAKGSVCRLHYPKPHGNRTLVSHPVEDAGVHGEEYYKALHYSKSGKSIAANRLLSIPLNRCSTKTVWIPTDSPEERTGILKPQQVLDTLEDNDTDIFSTGIVDKYQTRSRHPLLENMFGSFLHGAQDGQKCNHESLASCLPNMI